MAINHVLAALLASTLVCAQNVTHPPLPAPKGIPAPGLSGQGPYDPQAILAGGVIVPLYPPGSPFLKMECVQEAEKYNMRPGVPGRIESIVSIHNPSIEVHVAEASRNTGAVVILMAGGGHTTLNVGPKGADLVPLFYNYGITSIILRNRLRVDGYDVPRNRSVQECSSRIESHRVR